VAFTPWDNAEAMIVEGIRRAKQQILVQAYSFTSRTLAYALMRRRDAAWTCKSWRTASRPTAARRAASPNWFRRAFPLVLEVRYLSAHNKVMVIDAGTPDAAVITGS